MFPFLIWLAVKFVLPSESNKFEPNLAPTVAPSSYSKPRLPFVTSTNVLDEPIPEMDTRPTLLVVSSAIPITSLNTREPEPVPIPPMTPVLELIVMPSFLMLTFASSGAVPARRFTSFVSSADVKGSSNVKLEALLFLMPILPSCAVRLSNSVLFAPSK